MLKYILRCNFKKPQLILFKNRWKLNKDQVVRNILEKCIHQHRIRAILFYATSVKQVLKNC